ncbi:DUF3575 domain-containing protein [Dysgonomonas macrotermitis]|uniref:DUF3575 domain-containing protein n=1 Tax=Dysgonomonas macrotermitis TaxID=1346286 RepID=A0A1M5FQJ1_9BACT|nr:DUF3575 domain-containing protein [Dysgonomonas macrotermitis]SHF93820.1 Protein of unknown function [Dysgonomonas macrotermitis]
MKKKLFYICIFFLSVCGVNAQNTQENLYKPSFAIKTNALYWLTTTPNLGIEIGLSDKFTLDISGNYNPWDFGDNKKIKHWLVQPEIRYWFCERFNGHFIGFHGHYSEFNVGGIKMLGIEEHRYEGNLYGGGISYGYQWVLSNRWSLEATVGAGYAHIDYDKYRCEECGTKLKSDSKNYWGPTKVGLSVIYIFK